MGSAAGLLIGAGIFRPTTYSNLATTQYRPPQLPPADQEPGGETELSRAHAELDALFQTIIGLVNHLEVDRLLEDILARACGLIGTKHGYITVVNEDGDEMVTRATAGMFSPTRAIRVKKGVGLSGLVWETGQAQVVENYQQWPLRRDDMAHIKLHSVVAVPFFAGDRFSGVLGLAYAQEGRVFTAAEVNLLNRLGHLISLVLKNARLYSEVQQELAERKRAEEALSEAYFFNQQVITHADEGIVVYDKELRYVVWNSYMEQLLGFKAPQVLGKHPSEMFRHAAEIVPLLEQALAGHNVRSSEVYYNIPETGKSGWLVGTYGPHRNPRGEIIGVISVVSSVTAWKEAQERMRQQNEYLEALHETTLSLINRLELNDLLQAIIVRAGSLVGTPDGYLYLLTPDGSQMRAEIGLGIFKESNLIGRLIKPGEGLSGQVWQNDAPQVIEDYMNWPGQLNNLQNLSVHSVIGLPLKSGSKVIGVIGLAYQRSDRIFSEQEIQLLSRFAQLASLAIDNARLYSNTQRRLSELTTVQRVARAVNSTLQIDEVINTVVSQISTVFGYKMVSVYLRQDDKLALQAETGYQDVIDYIGLDEGVSGRVARTGQPAFVSNIENEPNFLLAEPDIKQAIIVPIKAADGLVVGTICVESNSEPVLTEDDFNLLSLLADQISVAIENARLFIDQRRSEEKYREVVNSVTEVIFQTDKYGRITFLNQACEDLLGYPIAQMLGQNSLVFIHSEDQERILASLLQHRSQGLMEYRDEARYSIKGGGWAWLGIYARIKYDEQGKYCGLAGTLNDITGRKMSQLLEHDRNHVLELVAKNQPMPLILAEITQMIERQRPEHGVICSLMLVRDGRLYEGARPNLPPTLALMLNGLPIEPYFGSCAAAILRGEPVLSQNVADAPEWVGDDLSLRRAALAAGIRTCWACPVLANNGEVLGTIALYYREEAATRPGDINLLETGSRLAAIAIEHRRLNDRLIHQAHHDVLTGLPNRLLLEDRLQQAIAMSARHRQDRLDAFDLAGANEQQIAVLFVDLDRFKPINDNLGHTVGDILLYEVARRLQNAVRQTDTVVRMGGDEFMLVLNELHSHHDAELVARKVLHALEQPFLIREHELFISASIGISLYPHDGETPEELVRKADSAMYRAKKQGRSNYHFYSSILSSNSLKKSTLNTAIAPVSTGLQRIKLESLLHKALERGEFELFYQPQYRYAPDPGSQANLQAQYRLVGVEALLRWNHPELGQIAPGRTNFIQIIEENGLIVPIGAWALDEACRQTKAWQTAGYRPLRMAVNVSVLQFGRTTFVETVTQALRRHELDPQWLELEITESMLLHKSQDQDTALKLLELRNLGVSIAIDDFGTGYSSLSYLQRLPIDILKIDQSFVRNIDFSQRRHKSHQTIIQTLAARPGSNDGVIVKAITTLAHSLGMKVVAEGVETEEQLAFLRELECEGVQGYYFSKPLPAYKLAELLAQPGE